MALNAGYRRQLFLPLGGLFTHVVQKASPLNSSCSIRRVNYPPPVVLPACASNGNYHTIKFVNHIKKCSQWALAYFLCVVPDPWQENETTFFLGCFFCSLLIEFFSRREFEILNIKFFVTGGEASTCSIASKRYPHITTYFSAVSKETLTTQF